MTGFAVPIPSVQESRGQASAKRGGALDALCLVLSNTRDGASKSSFFIRGFFLVQNQGWRGGLRNSASQ